MFKWNYKNDLSIRGNQLIMVFIAVSVSPKTKPADKGF